MQGCEYGSSRVLGRAGVGIWFVPCTRSCRGWVNMVRPVYSVVQGVGLKRIKGGRLGSNPCFCGVKIMLLWSKNYVMPIRPLRVFCINGIIK